MVRITSENAEYCHNCNEYHEADSPEAAAQLVADCEAGKWE